MIRKILFSLLSVFYNKNDSINDQENSHSDVINSPIKKLKKKIVKKKIINSLNVEFIILKIKIAKPYILLPY